MRKKFTDEEKCKLVERYYNGEAATDICIQADVARSIFYTWLKPFKTKNTQSGQIISVNDFFRQNQHIEKLEKVIEVLKKVKCTATSPLQEKLKELSSLHGKYSVHVLCEALDVARGTYYNHIFRNKKDNNIYKTRRLVLSEKIKQIYDDSNQIFGANKIRAILSDQGVAVSSEMVTELMRDMNLFSIGQMPREPTKNSVMNEKMIFSN